MTQDGRGDLWLPRRTTWRHEAAWETDAQHQRAIQHARKRGWLRGSGIPQLTMKGDREIARRPARRIAAAPAPALPLRCRPHCARPGGARRVWRGARCGPCWEAEGHGSHPAAAARNARLGQGYRPTREDRTAGWPPAAWALPRWAPAAPSPRRGGHQH